MREKKVLAAAWIKPEVKRLVEKLCQKHGVSMSEYIRRLIIEDLDRHHLFNMEEVKPIQSIRGELA
jgi:hypothetical protein